MELIYSPYDNGWYWQRHSDWATSQVFATKREAQQAARHKLLEWTK